MKDTNKLARITLKLLREEEVATALVLLTLANLAVSGCGLLPLLLVGGPLTKQITLGGRNNGVVFVGISLPPTTSPDNHHYH